MLNEFKVWCNTECELVEVFKKLEEAGIYWASGHKPYSSNVPIIHAPVGLIISQSKRDSKRFIRFNQYRNSYVRRNFPETTAKMTLVESLLPTRELIQIACKF